MAQRTEGVATALLSEVVTERFWERKHGVLPKAKEREACREEEKAQLRVEAQEARPEVWPRVEA